MWLLLKLEPSCKDGDQIREDSKHKLGKDKHKDKPEDKDSNNSNRNSLGITKGRA